MKQITIEMPEVKACSVEQCGYNQNKSCQARAITVGDTINPDCDTFFASEQRSKINNRNAGVGACKVASCQHNEGFECMADAIEVGYEDQKIHCLTYNPRA